MDPKGFEYINYNPDNEFKTGLRNNFENVGNTSPIQDENPENLYPNYGQESYKYQRPMNLSPTDAESNKYIDLNSEFNYNENRDFSGLLYNPKSGLRADAPIFKVHDNESQIFNYNRGYLPERSSTGIPKSDILETKDFEKVIYER